MHVLQLLLLALLAPAVLARAAKEPCDVHSDAVYGSIVKQDGQLRFTSGVLQGRKESGTSCPACVRLSGVASYLLKQRGNALRAKQHAAASHCQMVTASVYSNGAAGAVAHGAYLDSALTSSNFGKLRVSTSASYPDVEQMTAAGMLEGYLTAGAHNTAVTARAHESGVQNGGSCLSPR